MNIFITLLLALLFVLPYPARAFAQPSPFPSPAKITTYSGENFSPAVSPDGSQIAFVSDQSGNLELYLKPLDKPGARAVRITHHSSVDKSPAWSPDGAKLAFVSHREDPEGDIYILDLTQPEESRTPLRLTEIDHSDSSPAWSPDGETIYYSAISKIDETENLWKLDLQTKSSTPLTTDGGSMPAVSPDGKYLAFVSVAKDPNGDISILRFADGKIAQWTEGREADGFPAWDYTFKKIIFSRCADDTNLDGQFSFLDNPSIWIGDFSKDIFQQKPGKQNFRQLTSGATYDIFPATVPATFPETPKGVIYYASYAQTGGSSEKQVIHIQSIPKTGLSPKIPNPKTALNKMEDVDKEFPYEALMVLRNLLTDFSPFRNHNLPASIHYRMGRIFKELGNSLQARESFETVANNYSGSDPYAGLSRIEIINLQAESDSKAKPAHIAKTYSRAIQQLEKLALEHQKNPLVSGTALLRIGDFTLMAGDQEKAMGIYHRVAQEYAKEREIAAEAVYSKSKVYSNIGDTERLMEAFLNVLRQFPESVSWTRKTSLEIIGLTTKSGSMDKKTEKLYQLADSYPTLPILPAAALNKAGELFYTDHENLKAKQAYLRLLKQFPRETEEATKARFALAKIYFEEEDFEKSFNIYRELQVDPDLYEQSRREYLAKLIAKGEREFQTGEVKLSVKTFKGILEEDYSATEAHRGLVKAYASLGETPKAEEFYRQELEKLKMGNETWEMENGKWNKVNRQAQANYAMGLALTYAQPSKLEESLILIKKAVTLNGSNPYYFQTQGWLYEQKYQQTQENNHLELAADSYETAISLSRSLGLKKNLPNLALNLGNTYYWLQNYQGAYLQYKKRMESKVSFGHKKEERTRELIYFRRFGEVSFKLGKQEEAVEHFSKAISISKEQEKSTQTEKIATLYGRIALAYQDMGAHEKAVDYFSRAFGIYQKTGNQGNIAITLRNMANNLYFSTTGEGKGRKEPEALSKAMNRYFETIQWMEKGIPSAPTKKKQESALIQVNIQQGLDEKDTSQAAMGFSKKDEEKLIFNYIGKIYGDFKEYGKAVEYFQKKLALTPADLPLEGNIPILLEKAIIQNQIGNYLYLSGKNGEALNYFRQSLKGSMELKNQFGVAVNATNIGRLCSEAVRTGKSVPGVSLKEIVSLLDEAENHLEEAPENLNNGSLIHLKNSMGTLYFALSQEEEGGKTSSSEGNETKILLASLAELDRSYSYLKSAQNAFQEGIKVLEEVPVGVAKFNIVAAQAVLKNNLRLVKGEAGKPEGKTLPPDIRWQLTFASAAEAGSDAEEITILSQAASELEGIPYGYKKATKVEKEKASELFGRLAWLLLKSGKEKESFFMAERGRQWELKAGHEGSILFFDNPKKDKLYKELTKHSSKIHELHSGLPGKEFQPKLAKATQAYEDSLEKITKAFPELSSLFRPNSPEKLLKTVQSILGKDEAMIRAVPYWNSLMEWVITKDSFKVAMRPLPSSGSPFRFSNHRSSIINHQSKRVYLIPDTITLDTSLPGLEVVYIASMGHLVRCYQQRNLHTSNLLLAGKGPFESQNLQKTFRGITILDENKLTKSGFLAKAKESGVVSITSPVNMDNNDPANSTLHLTETGKIADRLELSRIYAMENRAHLMALSQLSQQREEPLLNYLLLADALSHAGYPHVLLNTGSYQMEMDKSFRSAFLAKVRSHAPSEALSMALKELPRQQSNYKLFGYGGMRKEERLSFAKKRLKKSIAGGIGSTKKKEWGKAIRNFEHAISLLDALDQDKYRDVLYKQLVSAASKQKDYQKAITYQQLLIQETLKTKKPEKIADVYHFLGYLYYKAEDFPLAVTNTRKAIEIYKENKLHKKMAKAYERLGITQGKLLDYREAMESHGISKKMSAEAGKKLNEGRQLNWMGSILFLRLNEYGKSITYFQEAREIFQAEKSWKDLLESLQGIGRAYQMQGRFDQAMDYFQQALDLATEKKLGHKVAECKLNFANVHWFRGDYQEAFVTLSSALERAEKDRDMRTQSLLFSTMGLVFWTLNDYPKALDNLERSLELAKEIKSQLDMASAYNNMGLIYRDSEKYQEALKYFQMAKEIDTKINSRWGLGYDHRNIGMTYLRMDELEKAGEHIGQAYDISKQVNNRTNMVKALLEKGNIALKKGKHQEAVDIYKETHALAEEIHLKEVQWRAVQGTARALAKMGQRSQAIKKYKESVSIVENMRASIHVEELRNGFVENKGELYEELIIQLLDDGKEKESFDYSERARARSFIDLLGNQKISLKNSVEQEEYEKLQALKLLIEETETTLKAEKDPAKKVEIDKSLKRQRTKYRDALIHLKSANPQLSNFVTVDPLKLKEVYTFLDPETALLEYMVSKKETVVWIVKKGSMKVVRIPLEKSGLKTMVMDFRKRIQSLAPLEDLSKELYATLLKPVEQEIAGSKMLGIVPHSILHYLSFSALRDEEGYLVEKFPLFFSPSASLFKFTMTGKSRTLPKETKVLAIGNPDLGDLNYDLPLAEMEANALRWDFPKVDVLIGDKARESWVVENISQYDIIHIASHGEFDSINPLFSSLKLTKDAKHDGNLEVNEIFGLQLNASLVTLSACQTGLGKVTGGDELIGLSRAFFYAGTRSLISSLWRVSDISTAVLIKHFYRNFGTMSKAEALRKAQLQVKRYYPHPSYWAGFNLTGNYY